MATPIHRGSRVAGLYVFPFNPLVTVHEIFKMVKEEAQEDSWTSGPLFQDVSVTETGQAQPQMHTQ